MRKEIMKDTCRKLLRYYWFFHER